MADFSGSQPFLSQGGGQFSSSKMPGALPNGAPPLWGHQQDVNVKSVVTSQLSYVNATNGTRGTLHHSHTGSLSSQSSRDSSPAPSRAGGPLPSGMWPQNVPNNTDAAVNHNSPAAPQQPPPGVGGGGPPVMPQQSVAQSQPIASFPTSHGQRMPPLGHVPLGSQQGQTVHRPVPVSTVMPPSSQAPPSFSTISRPTASMGNAPPSSYGQFSSKPMMTPMSGSGISSAPQSLAPTPGSQLPPFATTMAPQSTQHVQQYPPTGSGFGPSPQQPPSSVLGQSRPLRPPVPPGQLPAGPMLPGPSPLGQGHGLTGQTHSSPLPPGQPTGVPFQRPPFQLSQASVLSSHTTPPQGQYALRQGTMSTNNAPPSLSSMPPSVGQPPTSMASYSQPNPMLSAPHLPVNSMNQSTSASNQPIPRPAPCQYMPGHPPQQMTGSLQPSADVGHNINKRYPQHPAYQMGAESLTQPMNNLSVAQQGYNKLWGHEHHDLLQSRNILPPERIQAPKIIPVSDFQSNVNCSPDVFRCTLTKIPETDSLLKKSRLPLGVLIHPFRDLNNLPVIQCTTIVRCRTCRTYINPFVYFMDEKHWKCNLCYRVNELPNEFHFDPVTKTYGEPTRRPEIKSATIEFIAPSEYMLRPPQPAVYLFLLDVSRLAVESGYLQLVCETLLTELDRLPGDSRTAIGFITYDSSIHFYSLAEGLSAPQQMVVMDIDDVFLPCPENLLANFGERQELVRDLLNLLPSKFSESYDTGSALGAALQAAYKLMCPTGGRVSVFQCCLPNKGPGALKAREDPANRSGQDVPHLNPATDFYKQLALEFSGQQIAVDLFLLNQQYSDLATIGGVSKFSGGCIYHFPLFQSSNIQMAESLELAFRRYLTRKIGFEAVMRIRCSRGLSIHTFYGNFFVRSTDLLSLPNVNPDAGFGMQVSIEENLCDMQAVCFQAALLYTSSKGERRIRVHTLCLPIASSLPDILHAADQQCIIGLLAKMAVDRSYQYSVSDARDAFVNVVIDALSAYKLTQSSGASSGLIAPHSLRLLPLYILALLKNIAFRSGTVTRLDDRLFAMSQMKTLPLVNLIQFIYPDLYPVHCLDQYEEIVIEEHSVAMPPRLHLSAEKVDSHGAYLMDAGDQIFILICRSISPVFCENVLGVSSFNSIPEDMFELPDLDCEDSRKIRNFVSYLQSEKPYCAILHIIREDSKHRWKFFERLIEDRTEASLSYYEFLQHIKSQVK